MMIRTQVFKAVKAVVESQSKGELKPMLEDHVSSFLDPSYTSRPNKRAHLLTQAVKYGCTLSWIQHICMIQNFKLGWKDVNDALNEVAKRGNIPMLEWIMEHLIFARGYDDISAYLLDAAASTGQMKMLQWLDDKPYARANKCSFLDVKNLETFKWMCAKISQKCPHKCWDIHEVVKHAARKGELDFLKGIHELVGLPSEISHELIELAAMGGDLEMIQWFHLIFDGTYTKATIQSCCARGDLQIMKWLLAHSRFRPSTSDSLKCLGTPMEAAAMTDKLEVIKWILHMNQNDKKSILWKYTPDVMDHAARCGHLKILQWFHLHTNYECTTEAMDNASAFGHLDVVIWLHNNRKEGCSVRAMNSAASTGELEMVKWLHANRTEGCTTDAMDFASSNGDLKMVQWLHGNRREGCTKQAMDYAAERGHLHVIEWLQENRTEGCTTDAMDSAAEKGHLKVIQWLHKNRTEGCTPEAMNQAARNGHFDVVKWLYAKRTDGFSEDALVHAACGGHLEIVEWLDANNIVKAKPSPDIMSGVLTCGHLDLAKWLWEKGYPKCEVSRHLSLFAITGGLPMIKWILVAFRPQITHRIRNWWSDGCKNCSRIEKELVRYEQEHNLLTEVK